jgi:hypothetical protein
MVLVNDIIFEAKTRRPRFDRIKLGMSYNTIRSRNLQQA